VKKNTDNHLTFSARYLKNIIFLVMLRIPRTIILYKIPPMILKSFRYYIKNISSKFSNIFMSFLICVDHSHKLFKPHKIELLFVCFLQSFSTVKSTGLILIFLLKLRLNYDCIAIKIFIAPHFSFSGNLTRNV
jgi:hypothetical protein